MRLKLILFIFILALTMVGCDSCPTDAPQGLKAVRAVDKSHAANANQQPDPGRNPASIKAQGRPVQPRMVMRARASSASATDGISEAQQIQAMLDSLPDASTAVLHPEPMQVQRADKVIVRISRSSKIDITVVPAGQLAPTQQMVIEAGAVKATPYMHVRVTGDPYFTVAAISDEEQFVGNESAEWSFNVVPQKSGKWPLHIMMTNVLRTDSGTERVKDYPAKEEYITVSVLPAGAWARKFVRENWQWLWTTIVGPVALFIWAHRRRRRKKTAAYHGSTHHGAVRR